MIDDPALPGADALLDPVAAAALLSPAVEAGGGRLEQADLSQIRYQRGRRLAVRYGVGVAWPDGNRTAQTYVGLLDVEGPPEGVAVLDDGAGTRVGVWAYPHDPFLPGLPAAADLTAVRVLLGDLGAQNGPARITPRVYRPTSRAVLAVDGTSGQCYLKVVLPDRAAPLHALHDGLHGTLPVPASYGYAERQGIVVLQAMEGTPLSAALTRDEPLPAPADLLALLDRIADMRVAVPAGVPPAEGFTEYAATIARLLPDETERSRAIAEAAWDDWEADRVVHGDFYEAQILVADGRVSGLLDVDGLRGGDAVDDLATLLAHLDVLAWARPTAAPTIQGYRAEIATLATRSVPVDRLGRRVAGTLLGLALWPFRAQRVGWQAETRQLLDLAAARLPRRTLELRCP